MLNELLSGVSAGILILIGCCVYLACENAYAGAVLFSVALLCICMRGYALFTGRVGFLPERHDRAAVRSLLLALLGNALAACCLGPIIAYALPALGARAEILCAARLEQALPQAFIRGVLCGVLMYLAVSIYRDQKSTAALFFCVPVFILSGFEHSIADMGYFALSGIVSVRALLFILAVVAGNSLGGMLLPLLQSIKSKEQAR